MRYQARDRQFWLTAVAVFALIAMINYAPLFVGKIPFPSDEVLRHSAWNGQPHEQLPELIDIAAMFYPFRALLERGANEGALPLWNPHIMSGAPFQANAQSALFAPLNITYYVLPLKIAWATNLVIRLFLAGLFMTLFVRSIGGSPAGAILSGILFALCGFTIQWQGMSNGDSGIWLPLMCYAVHRLHSTPNASSIAIAAAAFAMPLLSGHPETAAHSAVTACAMALWLWVFPHKTDSQRFDKRFMYAFLLAGLLAVGVASVQVIPTLEWLGQLGLQVEAPQPVLDRHQGQGFISRDITRNPSSAGVWIPEGSTYVGMLGLLAACLAPFHPSRRYVYFLAIIAIAAGAVAFGIQPVRWIVVHLPIIKAMKNGRLTLVVDFALAALAGLGVSAVARQSEIFTSTARRWAVVLVSTLFLALCFGLYKVHQATLTGVELSRSPLSSLVFLVAAFVVLALSLGGKLKGRVFPILLFGLSGLEMLSFSYGYLRFASLSNVFPSAAVLDFLRTRDSSEPFRVAKDRVPIPHNAGMIYGFEAADGYDLTTARTRTFNADMIEPREDGVMFLAEKILAVHDRRLDMLNVKYLMVSRPGAEFDMISASDRFVPVFNQESVSVFENKTALPRFFCVPLSGIEVIAETSAQLSRLKESNFDPERSVIFSEAPGEIDRPSSKPAELAARIQVTRKGINGYQLRVVSNEPSILVVSQMYYPGWKATVDGSTVGVYPVDLSLTGIPVPSGSHDIRMFFQPASFRIGLALSLVSVAIVSVVLLRRLPSSAEEGWLRH
jgi:Bacterial membrane protein YfhO